MTSKDCLDKLERLEKDYLNRIENFIKRLKEELSIATINGEKHFMGENLKKIDKLAKEFNLK